MIVDVAAGCRTGHPQMSLFVTAVPANGDEAVGIRRQVNARRILGEVRHTAPGGARDHDGLTATRGGGRSGIPHDVRGCGDTGLIATPLRRRLVKHDARAVRRPHRLPQRAHHLTEQYRGHGARRHGRLIQATAVVGPGDPRERLAVGRPGRLRLDAGQCGDATRRASGVVHHVQFLERDERELLAVGTRHGVADLPHRELRAVGNGILERQLRSGLERGLHAERDLRLSAAVDRHAPDLVGVARDQLFRVGREAHARQRVQRRARFHLVALRGIREPALVAGGEFTHPESRLLFVARAVHQPLAVGAERGAHR